MHRKVAAVIVAALALGVASCGGSEPSLTRAQLVSRIEATCRQAQEQLSRQGSRNESGHGGADRFLIAIVANQTTVVARVDGLNASDPAKDDFEAFKQSLQDRLDLFKRIQSAGNPERAMQASQREGEAISRRLRTAADDLGLRSCV